MPSRQSLFPSPDPQEIKAARARYNLTQSKSAQMVCAARRTWQCWEAGVPMPPGLWELYNLKAVISMEIVSDLLKIPSPLAGRWLKLIKIPLKSEMPQIPIESNP